MAQTQPVSYEAPFAGFVEGKPDDPAYLFRTDILKLTQHIRSNLTYSAKSKSNIRTLFQQTEETMRQRYNNKSDFSENQPDKEDDSIWGRVHQDNFLLGMAIFLTKHMPQYLPQHKILVALCTSASVKRALLSRINANFSPQSDLELIFDKTMEAEFAKTWCAGYKLISDIYYPLRKKILYLADANEKLVPLPAEVVEIIPDDDPLCYL